MAQTSRTKRAMSNASLISSENTSPQPGPSKKRKSEQSPAPDMVGAVPTYQSSSSLEANMTADDTAMEVSAGQDQGDESWTKVEKRKAKKAKKVEVNFFPFFLKSLLTGFMNFWNIRTGSPCWTIVPRRDSSTSIVKS